MSFSFSVPASPSSTFEEAVATTRAASQESLANNDYMLTQYASETCDAVCKAAVDLVDSFGEQGTVTATLSGHHASDGSARTASVSVSLSPAQAPNVPEPKPADEPTEPAKAEQQ